MSGNTVFLHDSSGGDRSGYAVTIYLDCAGTLITNRWVLSSPRLCAFWDSGTRLSMGCNNPDDCVYRNEKIDLFFDTPGYSGAGE